jgi:hypothetical protein
MKTFTAALLFILSLLSPIAAARADSVSQPSTPSRLSRSVPLPEGDDDKKDDKKDDDEEDEEEYCGLSSRAALDARRAV